MLFPALGQPSLEPACPFFGVLWGLAVEGTPADLSSPAAGPACFGLFWGGNVWIAEGPAFRCSLPGSNKAPGGAGLGVTSSPPS